MVTKCQETSKVLVLRIASEVTKVCMGILFFCIQLVLSRVTLECTS